MKRLSNQDAERYYFDLFRLHYEMPIGDLVLTDKPVAIVRANSTVGIEIANFYLADGADAAS